MIEILFGIACFIIAFLSCVIMYLLDLEQMRERHFEMAKHVERTKNENSI